MVVVIAWRKWGVVVSAGDNIYEIRVLTGLFRRLVSLGAL